MQQSSSCLLQPVESIQGCSASLNLIVALRSQMASKAADDSDRYERIPEGLRVKMMAFQREGVRFALAHGGRVLIGDEMGAALPRDGEELTPAFETGVGSSGIQHARTLVICVVEAASVTSTCLSGRMLTADQVWGRRSRRLRLLLHTRTTGLASS